MKKIIKSLAILVVVGAIATGATLAYFNDTETSEGNTITAGSLNLQLECPAPVVDHVDPLHPESGTDTTGAGIDSLNGGELATLANSDDNRYASNYGWWTSFSNITGETWPVGYLLNENLNFGMPNIPTGATVTNASLKFEWRRGTGVNAARIRVYDGSTWQIVALALPTSNTDTTDTIDLYDLGFTTKTKIDALQIQFQATQSGGYNAFDNASKTAIDLVEVNASYTTIGSPYWCEDGLTGQFNVSNVKPTDIGNPVATVKYKNAGNIAGTLKLQVSNIVDNENTRSALETTAGDTTDTSGELSPFLHLWVNGSDAGSLASLVTTPLNLGTLAGDADSSLTLNWKFEDDADVNKAQSDGTTFNIDFVLEQNP